MDKSIQISEKEEVTADSTAVPFKKAKFAWQIKGNKSQMGDVSENDTSITDNSMNTTDTACEGAKNVLPQKAVDVLGSNDHEMDVADPGIGSGDLSAESSTEESFDTDEENFQSLLSEVKDNSLRINSNIPNLYDTRGYPRLPTMGNHNHPIIDRPGEHDGSIASALSLADWMEEYFSTMHRNDMGLSRWQRKQVSKGIIDNTVNKVLEDMGFVPLAEESNRQPQSVNTEPDFNPLQIENAGISEAIRQQGLNVHSRSATRHLNEQKNENSNVPHLCGEEPHSSNKMTSIWPMPCTCKKQQSTISSFSTSESSTSTNSFNSSAANSKLNAPPDVHQSTKGEDIFDAAVSFAISEKGLSVLPVNK